MDVLAACLQALYRKWQINKGLRRAGSQQRKSAFRYNAYRPCTPRMAHLSIHGCTCCVPASVVSKVADKQSTAKCCEPEAQVRPFGITSTRLVGQGWSTRAYMVVLAACPQPVDPNGQTNNVP